MTRRRTRHVVASLAGALALTAGLTGCGDDVADRPEEATTTTTTEPIAARRPYESALLERDYRWTTESGEVRVLPTEVWVPDGPGPFPLVAFAHGMDGHPRKFHQLFDALVEAGYVVVAPAFPLSAEGNGGNVGAAVADAPNQALDLDHVVAEVRAESGQDDGDLTGLVDDDRLAVVGLSLGGGTTLLATYTDCCEELRPAVAVAYSPVPFGTELDAGATPLVLVHGTDDRTLPYQGSRDLFDGAANRRWLVTLDQGSHSAPYEDNVSPFDELVPEFTIDILDQFLLDDEGGVAAATAAIEASGNARIESAG